MSVGPDETELLTAFARAASKAQDIEAVLQQMNIAADVATDTENRSFEEIVAENETLPLGPLKEKFLNGRGEMVERTRTSRSSSDVEVGPPMAARQFVCSASLCWAYLACGADCVAKRDFLRS
jgi:hypothetical protein